LFVYGAAGFGGAGGCGILRGGAQLVANVATIAMSNSTPVILLFIVMLFIL
jgi:hypothetical protein